MPDAPARPLTKRAIAAELTRRKLLDTALDLYSRHKFTEVTIRDIAGAAGVAHGLLSHHFGGKEGLTRRHWRRSANSSSQPARPIPTTPRASSSAPCSAPTSATSRTTAHCPST